MRRGPLPPNILANPGQLLASLARNVIANTVTTSGVGQSALSSPPPALPAAPSAPSSLRPQVAESTSAQRNSYAPGAPVIAAPVQGPPAPPPPSSPATSINTVNTGDLHAHERENSAKSKRQEDDDEMKLVRRNLEALSKKDLNLLKSSRSRLYDFPTQVPTVLSSVYANIKQ